MRTAYETQSWPQQQSNQWIKQKSLHKEHDSMATLTRRSALAATEIRPDASWRDLYRAGGVSSAVFVALIVVSLVLEFTTPRPPEAGGAATLEHIASHRKLYLLKQALWLGPSVCAMVVFLSLYAALKHLNKSVAAIGSLVGVSSWALTLAWPATGGGAPSLVYLSDQYQAATTDEQRAAFVAAAEAFIAQNNFPSAPGILTPVGILVLSFLMLRGVFHRGVGYLGIATGALGTVSEVFRPVLGLGYLGYGLLLPAWFIAVGWKLYRLG
jgi:hypothetical protein